MIRKESKGVGKTHMGLHHVVIDMHKSVANPLVRMSPIVKAKLKRKSIAAQRHVKEAAVDLALQEDKKKSLLSARIKEEVRALVDKKESFFGAKTPDSAFDQFLSRILRKTCLTASSVTTHTSQDTCVESVHMCVFLSVWAYIFWYTTSTSVDVTAINYMKVEWNAAGFAHVCSLLIQFGGMLSSHIGTMLSLRQGTFSRHYFLGSGHYTHHMISYTEKHVNRHVRIGHFLSCTFFLLSLLLIFTEPKRDSVAFVLGMLAWDVVVAMTFYHLELFHGNLASRVEDHTFNFKMLYVLTEEVIHEKHKDTPRFDELVRATRRTLAALQLFSWDWEQHMLCALITPIGMGVFSMYQAMWCFQVEKNYLAVPMLLMVCVSCAAYTVWVLKTLATPAMNTRSFLRLLDFSDMPHICDDAHSHRCIDEVRRLINTRGSVKFKGLSITPTFVFQFVFMLSKFFGLIITLAFLTFSDKCW